MAIITCKFDESYNDKIMCVGGWIAEPEEWRKLEIAWRNRITYANSNVRADQQISGFHATEMNCKTGEFANWDKAMCMRLSRKLIGVIAKRRIGGLGVACDMNAVREVFPQGDEETLKRRTYVLCIKTLMVEIAHIMNEFFPGDQVHVVHESGNWNAEALQAYDLMVEEKKEWDKRSVFCGFSSLPKAQSIGFEACDLFAYEVFKGVSAKVSNPEAVTRGAVIEMRQRKIPMTAKWLNLEAISALRLVMKDSGKYPDLDKQGIT